MPLAPRARLLGWADTVTLLAIASGFAIPMLTKSILVYSILNQTLVSVVAAQSVWIMLRMNLLTFATPAFMALGGYTVAIAGRYGVNDAFAMTAAAFLVPALVAVPLGALVLRLRGTYFVLVTFVLSQIMQLLLFVTPGLTGGSDGIAGIPAVSLLGTEMMTNRQVLTGVELPLALPLIVTGLRLSAVQITATATLGAFVGYECLGTPIVQGLARGVAGRPQLVGGALLVIAAALLTDAVIGRLIPRIVRWPSGLR